MPTINDRETIKDYFTYLYNLSKLSKTDFAKELGVSQPVVSNILTGGHDVSSNIIKNVYLKYGINLETIVDKNLIKFLSSDTFETINMTTITGLANYILHHFKTCNTLDEGLLK